MRPDSVDRSYGREVWRVTVGEAFAPAVRSQPLEQVPARPKPCTALDCRQLAPSDALPHRGFRDPEQPGDLPEGEPVVFVVWSGVNTLGSREVAAQPELLGSSARRRPRCLDLFPIQRAPTLARRGQLAFGSELRHVADMAAENGCCLSIADFRNHLEPSPHLRPKTVWPGYPAATSRCGGQPASRVTVAAVVYRDHPEVAAVGVPAESLDPQDF